MSVYARNLRKACADLVAGQAVLTAEKLNKNGIHYWCRSRRPFETSKHKVLVVDGDATVRESLTTLLSTGYRVTTAVNGFDVLL